MLQMVFCNTLQDSTVRMWNIEESDKIPIVLENKRAQGLKVTKVGNASRVLGESPKWVMLT